jgi:hypothetical protein
VSGNEKLSTVLPISGPFADVTGGIVTNAIKPKAARNAVKIRLISRSP